MNIRRETALLAGLASLSVLVLGSCSATPSIDARIFVQGPPTGSFNEGVSAVFERHCGSLDCHGQLGRPLRIYSANGLRLPNDAGLVPGAGATTIDEQNENYRSIVAVQPEKMTQVVQAAPTCAVPCADAFTLLILQKPLDLQHHKGGAVISKGDTASTCIANWIESAAGAQPDPACVPASALP